MPAANRVLAEVGRELLVESKAKFVPIFPNTSKLWAMLQGV